MECFQAWKIGMQQCVASMDIILEGITCQYTNFINNVLFLNQSH